MATDSDEVHTRFSRGRASIILPLKASEVPELERYDEDRTEEDAVPEVLLGFIVTIGVIGGVLICAALAQMIKGGYGK